MANNKEILNMLTPVPLSGPIGETLLNDMLFHRVMSLSQSGLKSLSCALLELAPDSVKNVRVLNTVDYGSVASDKMIILDLKIELDNAKILNMEVMSYQDIHWENRSLLYLCRAFDNLASGDNYSLIKPTTHVSILKHPLYGDPKEFYEHYLLRNSTTGRIYNSNFRMNVLNLDYTHLATREDKKHHLDHWAKMFTAKTWEELPLETDDPAFKEVAEIMYAVNKDVHERTMFEAHRKYLEVTGTARADVEQARAEAAEAKAKLEAAREEIARRDAEIARLRTLLEERE